MRIGHEPEFDFLNDTHDTHFFERKRQTVQKSGEKRVTNVINNLVELHCTLRRALRTLVGQVLFLPTMP